MKEKVFQLEIAKSFKYLYPKGVYIKIPDSYGNACFSAVKYIDAIFFYKKKFYGLEYKQIREPKAFPKNQLNDVQRETLANISANDGFAYVVINYRFGRGKTRTDVAIFLSYDEFVGLEAKFQKRKSIPYKAVMGYGVKIEYTRVKDSDNSLKIWNLQEFLAS